ncbi:BTAD domain-containing putative transcriptional regulator [Streptomyces sp. NPDC058576]|uniref:AfsR/SARP family transcriptional regulator n=1 Tax=Streptomyces sp. NPDC058576 TaxID=3346547 RepID=UPI003663CE87
MLRFFVLGELEVCSPHGSVALRGAIQRTLFQALLFSEGRVLTGDQLVRELWGQDPPDGVANALQAHASRLRRKLAALEPHRPAPRVLGHPQGYQLLLDEATLDAADFTAAVRRARDIADHDPPAATTMLRKALNTWRGPVLGGETGGAVCRAAVTRYEECRIRALELLFDTELALGRHTDILGELREVCAENPLRERFFEQLMLALYRAGRQAEALEVYRGLWSRLSVELGIEPSPLLRRTEQAILRHDRPLLDPPAGRRTPALSATI